MGTIVYQISGDQNPYTVQLLPGFFLVQVNVPGVYQITDVPNGDYTLRITDKNGCINDLPVSISDYASTTTTEVTTTTTTVIEVVPCNMFMFVNNGTVYAKEYEITLSSNTGFVALSFSVSSVPVRFVLEYDGVPVIDTGYHGSSDYQELLDLTLIILGEATSVIDTNTEYGLSFIKTTATESAILHVYAPLNNASGTFSVSCVDSTYEQTFEGEFDDHLCILSNTTTTTTTTEIPVTTTTTTEACIGTEERDFIINLTSRTVIRNFICRFAELPVGFVDVYRMTESSPGVWEKTPVAYTYNEEEWLTVYGFEIQIDNSEDLSGVIVEYEYEQQTR